VPNTYLKSSQIARASIGLLYRQLVIARTVWTDAVNPGEFTGALNDTVNLRVPARRTARKRTLRAGTAIVNDTSTEFSVPVQLTTDVYNGAPVTDEELTLDITDFAQQVLNPQVRAVVEGVEDEIADEIEGADYSVGDGNLLDPTNGEFVVSGNTDWYRVFARAARILDDRFVPTTDRYALVGGEVKEEITLDERFIRADSVGADRANDLLSERIIGRIAGFTVVYSPFIGSNDAYCYHRTAFILATRAPVVPAGVAFGETRGVGQPGGDVGTYQGLAIRWIRDYDYTNTTDRSLVNTWVGTATVEDAVDPSNSASATKLYRAVAIRNNS
jgi:hypothetical protein